MAAWTDEESQRLTELHARGKSLHFIADEMDRSKRTISVWATKLGLSFDRAATAKAADAVHVDNKARRALLESRLLDDAGKVLDQLWSPATVVHWDKDEMHRDVLEQPTFADQRSIVQAVATAVTTANKLAQLNSDGRDLPAVDAWLEAMTGGDTE